MHDYFKIMLEETKNTNSLGIDLKILRYDFEYKPILIGGKALEYYGVRDSDNDYDFIVSEDDIARLGSMYTDYHKDLSGDLGVAIYDFELWKSICLLDYDFFIEGAIEEDDYYVISFEKLMFMKVLTISSEKSKRDLELMRDRMAVINTIYHDYC